METGVSQEEFVGVRAWALAIGALGLVELGISSDLFFTIVVAMLLGKKMIAAILLEKIVAIKTKTGQAPCTELSTSLFSY